MRASWPPSPRKRAWRTVAHYPRTACPRSPENRGTLCALPPLSASRKARMENSTTLHDPCWPLFAREPGHRMRASAAPPRPQSTSRAVALRVVPRARPPGLPDRSSTPRRASAGPPSGRLFPLRSPPPPDRGTQPPGPFAARPGRGATRLLASAGRDKSDSVVRVRRRGGAVHPRPLPSPRRRGGDQRQGLRRTAGDTQPPVRARGRGNLRVQLLCGREPGNAGARQLLCLDGRSDPSPAQNGRSGIHVFRCAGGGVCRCCRLGQRMQHDGGGDDSSGLLSGALPRQPIPDAGPAFGNGGTKLDGVLVGIARLRRLEDTTPSAGLRGAACAGAARAAEGPAALTQHLCAERDAEVDARLARSGMEAEEGPTPRRGLVAEAAPAGVPLRHVLRVGPRPLRRPDDPDVRPDGDARRGRPSYGLAAARRKGGRLATSAIGDSDCGVRDDPVQGGLGRVPDGPLSVVQCRAEGGHGALRSGADFAEGLGC
jgi:hypothetical protein